MDWSAELTKTSHRETVLHVHWILFPGVFTLVSLLAGCGGGGAGASFAGSWCWRFTDPLQGGQATQRLTFSQGKYLEQFVYEGYSPPTVISGGGTFSAFQDPEGQATLRLEVDPASCGALGNPCVSETYCYAFADSDHVTLRLGAINNGQTICCDPAQTQLCVRAFQHTMNC